MRTDQEQPPTRDLFRLGSCLTCGYSLTGLPPDGVCPECGAAYDNDTIVLHGWGAGSRASPATVHPRMLVLYGLFAGFQIFNAVMTNRRGSIRPSTIVLVLFWLGLVAFFAWRRRWNTRLPGLIQVHLSAQGGKQIESTGRAKIAEVTSWSRMHEFMFHEVREGEWRLRLRKRWRFGNTSTAVVDAVVQFSSGEATALRTQIHQWQRAAAAAALAAARNPAS